MGDETASQLRALRNELAEETKAIDQVKEKLDALSRRWNEPQQNDVALAVFALAGFVQYRLIEGMSRDDLEPFMAAYLRLSRGQEGLACPGHHELPAQTEAASPAERAAMSQWWPAWLPDGEKLRRIRRSHAMTPSTCGLGAAAIRAPLPP